MIDFKPLTRLVHIEGMAARAAVVFLLVLGCVFLLAGRALAVDEENCLFCHGYRGLSYITSEGKVAAGGQEGEFRLLYVPRTFILTARTVI